ncbi:hypothetical protein ANTPLA_LOCUS8314 [Anthophora plagiata]
MFSLHNELSGSFTFSSILIATFAPANVDLRYLASIDAAPRIDELKSKGREGVRIAKRLRRRKYQGRSRSSPAKDAHIAQIAPIVRPPIHHQIPVSQTAVTAPTAIVGKVTTRLRDEEAKESRKRRITDPRSQPGRHATPGHQRRKVLVAEIHLKTTVSECSTSSCSCSECDYSDSYSSEDDCCCSSRKPTRKTKA